MNFPWLFGGLFLLLNGLRDTFPVLLAAILHECGHGLACLVLGVPIRFFRPTAAGAVIGYDPSALSYTREAWIALSGPLANLAGVLVCFPGECGRMRALFGISSLALAVFNLLPIRHLDGGVLLTSLLLPRLGVGRGEIFCEKISRIFTFLLWICAVSVQMRCGGNLSLLLISVYLLTKIAGE